MNPQGVDISGLKVPSADELAHDYLGRTVLGTSHAKYPTSILEIQFFRHFLSGPDRAIVTVVKVVFHFRSAGSFPPGRALISDATNLTTAGGAKSRSRQPDNL